MEPEHKKILKPLVLTLRHLLEGRYDEHGVWHGGDLEARMNSLGVWWDRDSIPADAVSYQSDEDRHARDVIDAYLALREEAGIDRRAAIEEYVRETAYTWANRLLIFRCMEARDLIDPQVVLTKEAYGGRSQAHNRLVQKHPERCSGADGGLFAMLEEAFAVHAKHLPLLFDPKAPGVSLRPSVAALKKCIGLLSGTESLNGNGPATNEVFAAPDALGWSYQYWNTEEKDRVFAKVKTKKAKIAGADIIPATQLYTEPYMVKFLVQNSLGATWMGMYPESDLAEDWEYYVKDADRAPVRKKNVENITFLDPACGSGHFLIEAFDLYFRMYEAEGKYTDPETICKKILTRNLYGIDIDERAVQIARAALWMKGAEQVFDFKGTPKNIIATNIRLPQGKDHLKSFLTKHPEDAPLQPALNSIFEGLAHADELGSLLQIEEPVEKELRHLKERLGGQTTLTKSEHTKGELTGGLDSGLTGQTSFTGPMTDDDWEAWKDGVIQRLADHFKEEAEAADLVNAFFSQNAGKGVRLFELLSKRYDVVAANPPYMHNRNIGSSIRTYLNFHYPISFMDLYTSFIERCSGLLKDNAHMAMVSQQSFMFLSSYSKLRKQLLDNGFLRIVAHLGPRAFSEISGEKVNIVLTNYQYKTKIPSKSIFFDLKNSSDKKDHLLKIIQNGQTENSFQINQSVFDAISGSPFIYWIDAPIREYLNRPSLNTGEVDSLATIKGGISTTDNDRFLRFFWETNNLNRWHNYRKGGPFCRWYGNSQYYVEWEENGLRLKTLVTENHGNPGKHLRNMQFFNCEGLTYSLMCGNGFSVRYFPKNCKFDNSGPGIFSNQIDIAVLAVYLNSTLVRYITKLFNPTMSVQSGDVGKLPLPLIDESLMEKSKKISQICLESKITLLNINPIEDIFTPSKFIKKNDLENELILTYYNHLIDILILETQNFDLKEIPQYLKTNGYPVLTFPLICGKYSSYPQLAEFNKIKIASNEYTELNNQIISNSQEISQIKSQLKQFFETGNLIFNDITSSKRGNIDSDDISESRENSIHLSNFYECLIEMSAIKLGIHPISVYWLLKEGIEEEGWRCIPEEQRITADRFTVMILRMLGHRWPKQIEAGEPVPDWADADGIIPLTSGAGEETLLERVRMRIAEEFPGGSVSSIEAEFEDVMGVSLEGWLHTKFFKHHTKQFKKRPIAWQVQSGKFTKKKQPAFACLVYYHKLDGDTLYKIKNQYVGPLRQKYETEMRGIEGIPVESRNEAQAKRYRELGDLIAELKAFGETLTEVAETGFTGKPLEKIIAAEPIDAWCSVDGVKPFPADTGALLRQEQKYIPDINDGVRVNVAPLQKAGLLAGDVIAKKDLQKAIDDRAEWRADERRWCREGKLPKCGWWPQEEEP